MTEPDGNGKHSLAILQRGNPRRDVYTGCSEHLVFVRASLAESIQLPTLRHNRRAIRNSRNGHRDVEVPQVEYLKGAFCETRIDVQGVQG